MARQFLATQTHGTGPVSGITIFALLLPDIVWAHAFPQARGRLVGIHELLPDQSPRTKDVCLFCCERNIAYHTAPIEAGWRRCVIKRIGPQHAAANVKLRIDIERSPVNGLPYAVAYITETVDGVRKKTTMSSWIALRAGRPQLLIVERDEDDVDGSSNSSDAENSVIKPNNE